MMRLLIPVDIYKSNLNKLIQQGLPPPVAERIWKNKILWLIVMHPDDISKVRCLFLDVIYFGNHQKAVNI